MLTRVHADAFSFWSIVLSTLLILLVFVLHNLVQIWVASRYGDPTPYHEEGFTRDPRQYFDMLGLCSFFLLGIGWTPRITLGSAYQYVSKSAEVMIWYSGPLTFLLMALVYNLLSAVFYVTNMRYINISLGTAGCYMVLHALAHLLPIWPLDGGQAALAWGDVRLADGNCFIWLLQRPNGIIKCRARCKVHVVS